MIFVRHSSRLLLSVCIKYNFKEKALSFSRSSTISAVIWPIKSKPHKKVLDSIV